MNIGRYLTFIVLATGLLQGCLGTKYLKEGESILFRQKIKGTQNIDKDALEELYTQKPNRKFSKLPFAPYVWVYKEGERDYDKEELRQEKEELIAEYDHKIGLLKPNTREWGRLKRKKAKKVARIEKDINEGNLLMRWGEPLAVYDSTATRNTIESFQLYLESKGYFRSKVDHKKIVRGKKVISRYYVHEGLPHELAKIYVQVQDSAIRRLLDSKKEESLLKKGDNYDQEKLGAERERLELLLKDNGYYEFSRGYISFDVDTAFAERKVAIKTTITNPTKGASHKVFTIDRVNFSTNVKDMTLKDTLMKNEEYRGVHYRYFERRYNKKILDRRNYLYPHDLYSKSNTFSTQRQLANLDMFKFININYDSSGGRFVANIFTSPLDRYQWSNEVGINVTEGLPGPFYNTTFKRRNLFGGLEILEINGRIGFEGVAAATNEEDFYTSAEVGANSSLTFPQFLVPFNEPLKSILNSVNPKTKLQAGYTYTKRPEYTRENINISNTYTWENEKNTRYNFTMTDVSIINSDLRGDFEKRLKELKNLGNNLINSFRPSFVSSMSFFATYNFNHYGSAKSKSSFLRVFLESGGTSLNFMGTGLLDRQKLVYYKYLKFNIDYRRNRPITKNSSVAYRVHAGLARPYGENGILPYEKYFFIGGSNSIRAWRPRRLGPGSYTPLRDIGGGDDNRRLDYSFEQQGEILLEASIEFRKDLFGFVDWAYFIDGGNIWTFKRDESRPGAQFTWEDFSKEIALATGLGLRFDFSFLILRLDAGLKVYDPARPFEKRFILTQGFNAPPFNNPFETEPLIFNIGVGYPF